MEQDRKERAKKQDDKKDAVQEQRLSLEDKEWEEEKNQAREDDKCLVHH